MTAKELPSPELLRKLLRYEPETGKLFWLPRGLEFFKDARSWKIWNTRYAGEEAFTAQSTDGYKIGTLLKGQYGAHRVIWAMQTGGWPKDQIDHIDRNVINNAWTNLRTATQSQNNANKVSKIKSTSKYLGVSLNKRYKNWIAQIGKDGRKKNLGTFCCEIQAAKAYDAAAIKFHGEFANLNFPEQARAALKGGEK